MIRRLSLAAAAVVLAGTSSSPRADDAPVPNATDLLFSEPQLAATKPGDVLTYSYSRKTADEAQYGPAFDDEIRLTVAKGSTEATRTVDAELFSGARRRPAGPFEDMTGNPVLSMMLEQNIEGLSKQLGGNPRYFKTAIRTALRDSAAVVPDAVRVGNRTEAGWRVSITPFKDDPHKARMKGLDALTYQFEVAKAVPGEVLQIRISAPGLSGNPLLEEKVDYVAKSD